jgi:hypothetical protein
MENHCLRVIMKKYGMVLALLILGGQFPGRRSLK